MTHMIKKIKPVKQPKKFIYECNCGTHELSSILHKKIQAGQRRFCANCREKINLKVNHGE